MLAQSQSNVDRASVLALFRRCIRCIQVMPDPNQRASYQIYVRDAFHRRTRMPSDSREASFAYRDGLDQVEQMEYYQRQMRIKHAQQERCSLSDESSIIADTATSGHEIISSLQNNNSSNKSSIPLWLLRHLPHLTQEDLDQYSRRLIEDGFDTVEFIEKELLVDDLEFMKKAHRRVLERYIKDKNV